jgi:hypothetical protein
MKILKKVPDCLHDGQLSSNTCTGTASVHIQVYCSTCRELLYEYLEDRQTNHCETYYANEVYKLLHTSEGKLKLATAMLKQHGWSIPKTWQSDKCNKQ